MSYKTLLSIMVLVCCCIGFMACEQNITVETVVHADGSIDRSVIMTEVDSSKINRNVFGISAEKGWTTEMERAETNNSKEGKKYNIRFKKNFKTIEDINAEMNTPDETVFRIRSEMKESFRWFYTYYTYTDTYVTLNRLHHPDPNDYFTIEDYSFIERLPAEGKPISKADSFYLEKLNEKIFDHFALRGFYEENYQSLLQALRENDVKQQWIDSIQGVKEVFFHEEVLKTKDFDDDYIFKLLQEIKEPVDLKRIKESYSNQNKEFERRGDFMSEAAECKFTNVVRLPWNVRESNADSVSGNTAFWQPPVTKILLKDYSMYATGRTINSWAIAVSLVVITLTILLYLRNNKRP